MGRMMSLVLMAGIGTMGLGSCGVLTDDRENCNVLCTGDLDDCEVSCDDDQDCLLDCQDEHDVCLGACDPDTNPDGTDDGGGGN